MTIDMLTVNRESTIPRFRNPRIRGSLTTFTRCKEAQAEFGWTIIGAAVGERGR
jgi:hypothetical protein